MGLLCLDLLQVIMLSTQIAIEKSDASFNKELFNLTCGTQLESARLPMFLIVL